MNVIRINDEVIDSDSLVKLLKLGGRFDEVIDDVVRVKVASHEAKRSGVVLQPEAVQERADQLRRLMGLHRAAEMNRYLEETKVSLTEYQAFVTDMLSYEKMMERVLSDQSVEKFFQLNSPKFDSIDVSHIVLDSEGKAREIAAILRDEPKRFAELAREHSFADTGKEGGYIGRVARGSLQADVEAKVFNAEVGTVLGPFPTEDELFYEIFMINGKQSPTLDDDTKTQIRRLLKDKWLADRAREHRVEVL
jgi:parvulin-like peptidyl-prolyl isomerase